MFCNGQLNREVWERGKMRQREAGRGGRRSRAWLYKASWWSSGLLQTCRHTQSSWRAAKSLGKVVQVLLSSTLQRGVPSWGEGDGPEDAAVIPMGPAIPRPGTQPSHQVIHSGCVAFSEAVRSMTHGRAGVRERLISSSSVPVSSLRCCCLSFASFPAEQKKSSFLSGLLE